MLNQFFIDYHLAASIKPYKMRQMQAISQSLPLFRFADFHRAVEAFLKDKTVGTRVNSNQNLQLIDLLQGKFPAHVKRGIRPSSNKICPVDYEKNEAFPDCFFWTFIDEKRSVAGVIRVVDFHREFHIDIALTQPDLLTEVLNEISDLSIEHSVYRNKYLQVALQSPIDDGYSSSTNGIEVIFKRPPSIGEAEIIFDPNVKKLVERNVVSFLKNRERLNELGLPMQRGVLFYGPPGTGKTYTCQYLYGRLKPITMITVSGKGLGEVRAICNLARILQPAVLLLEDVDLIFASREINLYSTALGEMMDELDAFKRKDSVLFILTTNSIDRLEKAIKDRPGRIAQCIYFGPPTSDLRKKYLARYLDGFDASQVSLSHVAEITDGASQAFLEEMIYRAIQIGSEDPSLNGTGDVRLTDAMFDEAVEEMTNKNNQSTGAIIGFMPK